MAKNKTGPPKNQTDYSSNWKKLQATLGTQTKKRKAEEPDHGHKHKRQRLEERAGSGKHGAKPANGKPANGNPANGNPANGRSASGKPRTGKKQDKTEMAKAETSQATDKNEIWFDDVDEMLLERPAGSQHRTDKDSLLRRNAVTFATKALAMDCEMVGVGKEGVESVLARVSLVNQHGHSVYDKFVKPREKVTDFRTHVSGIRPYNLRDAEEFLVVQKEVSDLLKGKLLVGHALHNDLKVLFLDHPRRQIRDTSSYKPFRQLFGGRKPSLKKLTAKVLGVSVQQGEHNSVQDAQAAMRLYMTHRKRWENEVSAFHRGKKKNAPAKKKKKKEDAKKVTFADTE